MTITELKPILEYLYSIKDIDTKYRREVQPYLSTIYELTKDFPEKSSPQKRIYALLHDKDCKCVVCGKNHGNPFRETCSEICYRKSDKGREETQKQMIEQGELKFKDLKEGYDFLVCRICGCKVGEINTSHLKFHDYTVEQYKKEFNTPTKTLKASENMRGDKNPAYQHGGKFSPFSDKFIHAVRTNKKELLEKCKETKIKNNSNNTTLGYWLKQTNDDIELAKDLLYKRQSTYSLEKYIERYGIDKGFVLFKESQERWQNNFYKSILENYEYDNIFDKRCEFKGEFYFLDICSDNKFKIGVAKYGVHNRYKKDAIYNVKYQHNNVLKYCFYMEQVLKRKLKNYSITINESVNDFGWTETFKIIDNNIIEQIIVYCNDRFNNIEKLLTDYN